ncbi:MAG TPA: universal stress protein [Kofleriaceae bacterium]|nr:universal stress protein [Kofleriaceae bacterium]
MAFAKILCAVDFSESSERAMAEAVRLAGEHDAELILFHTYYLPPFVLADTAGVSPALTQQLADDARAGLAEAVSRARALGARKLRSKLADGLPWLKIVKASKAEAVDLIVIGSHGRSGFARIALGSVAEMVVRHAPCPVLTVRGTAAPHPFEHVLVPVDFSPRSRDAAELALRLVRPGGAGITLLHVVEAPITWGELRPLEAYRDLDARGAAQLEAWIKQLTAGAPAPVRSQVRVGSAGAQILHALEADRSIDLVVMGSHGRTGLKRIVLGSVAEKTVRHAPCPVVIVHHPA